MTIPRYLLLLLALGGLLPRLPAQFNGGIGDGHDRIRVVQLDLSGMPAGVSALYTGGRGDGFDRQVVATALNGQSVAILYGGGRGDGFDRTSTSAALSGEEISILYAGGDGDGFDHHQAQVSLDGTSIAVLYTGGDGDGFDQTTTTLSLNGQSISGLFAGGTDDGFSAQLFTGSLTGTMLMLYAGGNGDGFDHQLVSFGLDGQSLAGVYQGGQGDGFDTETYLGVVPLPLTLIAFDAFPEQDYVLLRWQTEDELATDYFIIEKTRNGRDYAEVGQTDAAGYSEPGERLHYEMKDHQPYQGISFYRLLTTDLDGAISYSHLVEVEYATATDWDFALYPNPNTGRHLGLRPQGTLTGPTLQFEVLDVNGRLLYSGQMPADGTDHQFTLRQQLASGSYLIRVTDVQGKTRAKLLLVN